MNLIFNIISIVFTLVAISCFFLPDNVGIKETSIDTLILGNTYLILSYVARKMEE